MGARGDQCDTCGNQLDPHDLIDPVSTVSGLTPEFKNTEHYFLDLPALAQALSEWLDGVEVDGKWRPNVIAFSKHLLKDIRPRAMSRDINWGIPVPGWEDKPHKRLYVWFDAVVGYLSASIEWARRREKDGTGTADDWTQWWTNPEALSYYFMGKDNIVFHSQIWPAELLAYNGEENGAVSPEISARSTYRPRWWPGILTMENRSSPPQRALLFMCDVLELPARCSALLHFDRLRSQDSDFT